MKAQLFSSSGTKTGEIELPNIFNAKIREDICLKCFEAFKLNEFVPFSTYSKAGKRHSASGTISHQRHKWAMQYGRGISRVPRKTMWRRGTQFMWIGAETSGTRGGRKSHPPKLNSKEKKINSNEIKLALNSAVASTAHKNYVLKRYTSLHENSIHSLPFVIESLPTKAKELIPAMEKMLGNLSNLALKKKEVRSGKGKRRNRRYKTTNAGVLIVAGEKEKAKLKGLEIKNIKDVRISDLYPLGRLTIYTKQALEEMKNA